MDGLASDVKQNLNLVWTSIPATMPALVQKKMENHDVARAQKVLLEMETSVMVRQAKAFVDKNNQDFKKLRIPHLTNILTVVFAKYRI